MIVAAVAEPLSLGEQNFVSAISYGFDLKSRLQQCFVICIIVQAGF